MRRGELEVIAGRIRTRDYRGRTARRGSLPEQVFAAVMSQDGEAAAVDVVGAFDGVAMIPVRSGGPVHIDTACG